MPFTNDEMGNIDASIGIPGWCHRATPAIDRQSLEKALTHYDTAAAGAPHKDRLYAPEMLTIMTAARAHLATLPKPEPKFRVVSCSAHGGVRATSSVQHSRRAALDLAAAWIKSGGFNSVAVEQVSP